MSDSREHSTPRISRNDPHDERDIETGVGAEDPLLPQQTEEPVLPDTDQPLQPLVNPHALVSTDEPVISKDYVPVRTDPIEGLDPRTIKRRLDRKVNECVPEIHIVGRITNGKDLVNDISEGAFCRWKVSAGKAWQHLGGELIGQTQVAYPSHNPTDKVVFEHPVDLHFACAGLQGWGALRIAVQVFRLDAFGRKLLGGYGFGHLPFTPGMHSVEVHLWRPLGSMEQEMAAFLLGETPCLVSQDPLYESAWKDRCRLITTSGGSVSLQVFVMTRYWKDQGLQPS